MFSSFSVGERLVILYGLEAAKNHVTRERRTGYGWYGYWPEKLIDIEYPKWLDKVSTKK
ncbi:MAG: hypothetical protein ABI285_00205 [Ginsengibacter sp.]